MVVALHAVRSLPESAEVTISLVTVEAIEAGIDGIDPRPLKGAGFEGKADQVHIWPEGARSRALVGLGSESEIDHRSFRRAGAVLARACSRYGRVGVELPAGGSATTGVRQALAEGVVLGGYSFSALKSNPTKPELRRVDVAGSAGVGAGNELKRGMAIATGQCLARDLVNEPGGSLTAPALADRAAEIGREAGLGVKVWTEAEIARQKLGGLLGVNRGSTNPARFVELTYRPEGEATAMLALVGKGVTFDAGGLNIKTAAGMLAMKMDMSGAAAVIGAMSVIGGLALTVEVRAFLPMTDNMLGGDATRPGDVLTIRNGKTIEVVNTDAEGRLILADALSLASEAKPDAIVDLATLTGACMVALGPRIAGLMGNDEAWIAQIQAAATAAGERVWPLPLPGDYESQFESDVADMKNLGGAHGGALTAALILKQFVADGIAWAHLDIAGPAFSDAVDGEMVKGGTGFGVRTLVELAAGFTRPS